jgi:hypothetical protein
VDICGPPPLQGDEEIFRSEPGPREVAWASTSGSVPGEREDGEGPSLGKLVAIRHSNLRAPVRGLSPTVGAGSVLNGGDQHGQFGNAIT